ncbi:MAG: hypothetical protein ACRD50_10470 [Candidatus Acidiferrales bacterium]
MRRFVLLFVVSGFLASLPAIAAPGRALGVVERADGAKLGGAVIASGSTVFAGDSFSTEGGGSLRARLGSVQLVLLSGTSVTLSGDPHAINANLIHGTAGFVSTAREFAMEVPGATIRPKSSEPTEARVTVVGPNEAVVSSLRGALEVNANGETYSIAEGTTYRLLTSAEQERQGAGAHPAMRNHTALEIVAGVTGAAFAVWGIQEVFESPVKP